MPTFGAVGSPYRVNQTITFDQVTHESGQAIALDSDGESIVVWSSPDSMDDYGVYARRFSAAGTPIGNEFRVNSVTTGNQRFGCVATDGDGDFVIAWTSTAQDGSGDGIYARRYDAFGNPRGTEFRVNTYTTFDQSNPTIAAAASGAFVIAWESVEQDGNESGIYAQRFRADGSVDGPEFRVNVYTASSQSYPSAAMNLAGDVVVSWTSFNQVGGGVNIYARGFGVGGLPSGGESLVTTTTTADQRFSSVAMDADGDFVVAWHGDMDSGSFGIYGRRFSANGTALGTPFQVNTITNLDQSYPSVAMDADGDFVIVWESAYGDGSGFGIYARRYIGGVAQGSDFRVNTYVDSNQRFPAVAMDSDGDFHVAWESYFEDTSFFGVYVQRYADADNNGDTAGPIVADVFASPNDISVVENGLLIGTISAFKVTFSETLSTTGGTGGVHSVTNPAQWALSRNGSDVSALIANVGFVSGGRPEATLMLSAPLIPGQYALTAKSTIQDLAGVGLDGDANGVGMPSDFTRHFVLSGPSVAAVQVNDGSTQRSRVTSLKITFDQLVGLPPASAFHLQNQKSMLTPTLSTAVDTSGSTTVVTLTFSGNSVEFGSLADGLYTLKVLASQIANFDGNGDGIPGDDYVLVGTPGNRFFRLFGDADGNGSVTAADFNAFRLAYGTSGPSIFDFDGDNQVSASDFNAFRTRYGVMI